MPEPDLSQPFTSSDLARIGLTRAALRRLVAQGVVRRVVRGVYAAADLGDDVAVRASAIALLLGEGHVACDRTAAWLHGLDLYPYSGHDVAPVVEMCVGPGRGASIGSGIGGHRRDLLPGEVTEVHGVAVTTPLRTALDLACVLERRDAMAALDAFRRRFGLSRAELAGALRSRFTGRRGVVQARNLVEHSDPRAESMRESWVRITIIDAGLPAPDLQVWVVDDGVPRYRLDLAYRRRKVAVEYDGEDGHLQTEEQIEDDEARRAWLRARGWVVIVVRSGDFTGARLDRWISALRVAMRPSYSNRRRLERGARDREF
ncbi:MAG TPA: type IV toxin-antitoxin system AbiEi family antitoxin domain-containing protein [Nocardioides sp.]|nr:type IV toxin-antitoxin system AbiEi family antitoxin domain-containing protein [Nocardioides sp.]